MKRTLLAAAAGFLAVTLCAPSVRAGDKKDENFTLWFDAAQPSVVDWNSHQGRGGDEWLVMGIHFSGCRVGRLRSCGLGFAWGSQKIRIDDGRDSWSEWRSTLLITAPQSIRLTDSAEGDPELDFTVTPFYNATYRRWGFMVGLSLGG